MAVSIGTRCTQTAFRVERPGPEKPEGPESKKTPGCGLGKWVPLAKAGMCELQHVQREKFSFKPHEFKVRQSQT